MLKLVGGYDLSVCVRVEIMKWADEFGFWRIGSSRIVLQELDRQIVTNLNLLHCHSGIWVHCARRFYENIVPCHTIFDIECPDILFRKFSDDGQYLITFSRNHQDLVVYRPTWLSYSCREQDCPDHDLPSKANKFESFFTQLYSVTLACSGELICKDFFLYSEKNQFGIFATSTAQIHDAPAVGVAIVSLRYQRIHILQIRDSGNLVDVRSIGEYCREDDELFLNSSTQASATSTIS
ncbi:UNVERIFIED_CONTAM: Light-mediated development protein DET1 [Sesamum radiatum]|uniref:Light-mediated development protein DET1 n=1 Tax=Sesamum radiatum TaxID=300843 RepID=A0AAW2NM30_SESRA